METKYQKFLYIHKLWLDFGECNFQMEEFFSEEVYENNIMSDFSQRY